MEATVFSVGRSVVNGALSYAKSAIAEEVALQLGVQRDQAFIADELEMMQGFLMAAHKEKDDDKVVKIWVKQVRDVAYDVEDCLQDFAVRVDKSFWWFIPSTLLDRRSVAKEMKELRAKVEDVSQRSARYRLIRGSFPKPAGTAEQSTISTEVQLQIAEAARTKLKESEKVDLAKLITDDQNDHRVIAVLGENNDFGVTSIIRDVYNNQDVKEMFECRAWVKLMHPFNPSNFFMGLVRQFYEDLCQGTEKEAQSTATGVKILKQMASQDNLVDEFNRYVTEKRYLVVITDVSTIEEWDWIKTYFPSMKGSWIILSTQKFEVASLCIEHRYTVSEIEQQWSSDKDFFVFYKQVDTKEKGKRRTGTTAEITIASSTETAGDENVQNPTRASSAFQDDQLIDRGKAKGEVIKLMHEDGLLIAVYGMGGVGKTTLAKSVYQQELGERFQRRAWLTMSHSFQDQEFLRELIRQLSHEERGNAEKLRTDSSNTEHKSGKEKEQLFENLTKTLSQQKCLIVLDDLSSIVELHCILGLLLEARNNSNRIIVTTRNIMLLQAVENKQIYRLDTLNEMEAIELFEKKVFQDVEEKEKIRYNQGMIEQRSLILKKCDGLPLAISTVGRFLASKPKTAMEWSSLNRHISAELEFNPGLGMINTVLTSSYEGLPYRLKACFLYLSIFHEDQKIRCKRLVRRYIAEGYSRATGNRSAEETGNSYIAELVSRSMVIPAHRRNGKTASLQVHDLIREIGISKSTEEDLVFTLEEGCSLDIQGKIRHLVISSTWIREKDEFCALDLSHLRSLTVFGKWKSFFLSYKKMRMLRVLDLEDTEGLRAHHLNEIGKFLHLNYLSLRGCRGILRLPNSLGNLRYLQTLDIRDTEIIKLPGTISKLRKLQYVRVGTIPGYDREQSGSKEIIRYGLMCSALCFGLVVSFLKWCYRPIFRLRCMGRRLCSFSSCVFVSYASIQLPAGIIGLLVFLAILPANLLFLTGAFLWVLMTYGFDGLPVIFMGLRPHGVKFPQGIRKLKALQTLGAINMKGEDAIVAELKYLTKLRKLRVTGLNKKNCVNFCRAIDKHKCLESLLVQSEGNPGLSGCLNGVSSPPENLFSLKLYGNLVKLPPWIKGLHNLVKLVLRSSRISDCSAAMQLLGELPNLATLRLWGASFEDGKEVHISFPRGAFPCLVMLDIRLVPERYSFKSFESSQFNLKSVEFEEGATPMLESVYFHGSYSGTDTGLFSGLVNLLSLKEFTVAIENYTNLFADEVQHQLAGNKNRPVLKRYHYSS